MSECHTIPHSKNGANSVHVATPPKDPNDAREIGTMIHKEEMPPIRPSVKFTLHASSDASVMMVRNTL